LQLFIARSIWHYGAGEKSKIQLEGAKMNVKIMSLSDDA